jgi:hypothetical protein
VKQRLHHRYTSSPWPPAPHQVANARLKHGDEIQFGGAAAVPNGTVISIGEALPPSAPHAHEAPYRPPCALVLQHPSLSPPTVPPNAIIYRYEEANGSPAPASAGGKGKRRTGTTPSTGNSTLAAPSPKRGKISDMSRVSPAVLAICRPMPGVVPAGVC